MNPQKRYQVFVSSTFRDLQEERQEVMQALLELNCIPSGMELFPAADEDQWTLIRRVIDDCDYYLVIVGGRYGSVAVDGISYTQKEYEYAIQTGKPVMAFLHEKPDAIPVGKSEQDSTMREKLKGFRAICEKRVCKYWTSPTDLGGKVSRSVIHLINTHPAVGWVRGDTVPDESTAQTINRLRNEIDALRRELERVRREPPKGSENKAQGKDPYVVHYTISKHYSLEKAPRDMTLCWDDVFSALAPRMIIEASEYTLTQALADYIVSRLRPQFGTDERLEVDSVDFNKIIVQLRALGLIVPSERKRSVKDRGNTYWSLTPFGDEYMHRLVAIPRATS